MGRQSIPFFGQREFKVLNFKNSSSNFFHVNVCREINVRWQKIDLIKFEVNVWNFELWYLELWNIKFKIGTVALDGNVVEILKRNFDVVDDPDELLETCLSLQLRSLLLLRLHVNVGRLGRFQCIKVIEIKKRDFVLISFGIQDLDSSFHVN